MKITAVNSNITNVLFFVPGTTTPATVSGFGSIFTDVEIANLTNMTDEERAQKEAAYREYLASQGLTTLQEGEVEPSPDTR